MLQFLSVDAYSQANALIDNWPDSADYFRKSAFELSRWRGGCCGNGGSSAF